MKLTDILVRDACRVDIRGRTKPEVLRELADALAGAIPRLDRSELYAMLLEREKLGTTAMGDGIAIPHARIEALDRVLAVFGLSRGGVDFDSLDGRPTHLFFLLVAPGREGSSHLLLLARLSRLLGIDGFRARLREVTSTDELFRAIEEEESRH
ncbi:MAG: PTS sugar transporter subunit IIA [Deltaproteobacteria bacterium]|nr:PTS sugar transporter subunit IIA [Deltaproteobacteria bacterium]